MLPGEWRSGWPGATLDRSKTCRVRLRGAGTGVDVEIAPVVRPAGLMLVNPACLRSPLRGARDERRRLAAPPTTSGCSNPSTSHHPVHGGRSPGRFVRRRRQRASWSSGIVAAVHVHEWRCGQHRRPVARHHPRHHVVGSQPPTTMASTTTTTTTLPVTVVSVTTSPLRQQLVADVPDPPRPQTAPATSEPPTTSEPGRHRRPRQPLSRTPPSTRVSTTTVEAETTTEPATTTTSRAGDDLADGHRRRRRAADDRVDDDGAADDRVDDDGAADDRVDDDGAADDRVDDDGAADDGVDDDGAADDRVDARRSRRRPSRRRPSRRRPSRRRRAADDRVDDDRATDDPTSTTTSIDLLDVIDVLDVLDVLDVIDVFDNLHLLDDDNHPATAVPGVRLAAAVHGSGCRVGCRNTNRNWPRGPQSPPSVLIVMRGGHGVVIGVNERVQNLDIEVLSDHWYVLRKATFDYLPP